MPDTKPDIWVTIGIKIAGFFVSFVGGIVTATWIVSSKVGGFDRRVSSIEKSQTRCQVETLGEIKLSLAKINSKLDSIPDIMDRKLTHTHSRIDDLLLRRKDDK